MLVENGEHEGRKTNGPIEKMVKVRCGEEDGEGPEGSYTGFDEMKAKGLEKARKPIEGREGAANKCRCKY